MGVHDLAEILPFQDVVIVAAALTGDTHHLIGRAELESMRTDAILVNIARGGLIDTEALVAALEREQIAGATERALGLRLTPHQFRHACGAIYLGVDPGGHEVVRHLLRIAVRRARGTRGPAHSRD